MMRWLCAQALVLCICSSAYAYDDGEEMHEAPLPDQIAELSSVMMNRYADMKERSSAGATMMLRAALTDATAVPAMFRARDERALDAYILILAEAAQQSADAFFIDLDEFRTKLSQAAGKDLSREDVAHTIQRLNDKYKVVGAAALADSKISVVVAIDTSASFMPDERLFLPEQLAQLDMKQTVSALIASLLAEEDKHIRDMPKKEFIARFHLDPSSLR